MLTYGGTPMTMMAWMPSASPVVSCGGQTSYSITSIACLPPIPYLSVELPLALNMHLFLIPQGCYAMLPQPSPRTLLIWQKSVSSGGYMVP